MLGQSLAVTSSLVLACDRPTIRSWFNQRQDSFLELVKNFEFRVMQALLGLHSTFDNSALAVVNRQLKFTGGHGGLKRRFEPLEERLGGFIAR